MRLSRVRFSLGTPLFAVVLVAANCWYYRQFYNDPILRMMGGVTFRLIPAGVGVFPLSNVALIGFLCFMARRFRTWAHGYRIDGPSPLWAFTFFSLGFLGLGCLACRYPRQRGLARGIPQISGGGMG